MGIEKIKGNVEGISGSHNFSAKQVKNRAYLGIPQDSTTFTGAGATSVKATKSLSEFLLDIMPNSIKRMVGIHEGMGEVQNQLINAIGTGLVAPVFIKYNPLSDTDKDTRTYTAWRQPVSAVLAVCTQAAIVIPFNSLIKKLSDVGYLGMRYNASLFPSDDYVKKLVIKETPEASHYNKKQMKKAIDEYNKAHFAPKLRSMIENDKIVFNTTDGRTASTLEMPKAEFKKLFLETVDSIIADEKLDRDNLLEVQFKKKMQRSIFFKEHPEETREVLTRLQNKLTTLLTQTNFNADAANVTDANKQFDKECKQLIKELKKDPSKKGIKDELIKMVKEIKNKNTTSDTSTLRIIQDKVTKMLDNVVRMEGMKDSNAIMSYVSEVISRRTSAIDETIAPLQQIRERLAKGEISVKEAQEIINQAISSSEGAVKQKLRAQGVAEADIPKRAEWVEGSAARLRSKVQSLSSCISDNLKKHVKANIDGYKRWTGLAVSLAILPVTCWLLNRIYPWFMDKAFPELSNKAASAKEKKNQKAEVK